jgi:hypothetical protein
MTTLPDPRGFINNKGLCYGVQKGRGGEGKGLGSREAGFDAGKGRESTAECRSGVLMAARMTWETMRWPPGDVDGQCIIMCRMKCREYIIMRTTL